jgi:hypothetical protein
LISSLASHLWYVRFARRSPGQIIEYFLFIGVILGAGIFIFGVIKLLRVGINEGLLHDPKIFVLFVLAAIGLPLLFMYPLFDSRKFIPTNLPIGLFYENNLPDILVYGMGTLWLLLGGWLISRPEGPEQAN